MPNFALLALSVSDDSTKWVAMCGGVLLILYTVFRGTKKKRKDPLDRPTPGSTLSQQRSVERQMSDLLVELSDMARQITAQLDTRSEKLQFLMREADEKIATLKGLQNGNGAGSSLGTSSGYSPPPPRLLINPPPEIDARHAEVYSLADQGMTAPDIARRLSRPNGEIELILALRSKA